MRDSSFSIYHTLTYDLTGVVGVNVLSELLHGTQADHGPTAKPERSHRPKLLMQTDKELMQTAFVDDVLQVSIPEEAKHNI